MDGAGGAFKVAEEKTTPTYWPYHVRYSIICMNGMTKRA